MKLNNYYDELINEGEINSNFITYLSFTHIYNSIIKKDKVTNKDIMDLGLNYSKKLDKMLENIDSPLNFVNDDILDIYNYTLPNLNKILNNPHSHIVKENKMIDKSKLKTIDNKTLIWLSPKSGMTIREKLSNVDKVSSSVKRFTYDVKENQVALTFFKNIRKLLLEKICIYNEHKDIFGTSDELKIKKLKQTINHIDLILKEDFSEVKKKEHTSPNNALIGNVNYSSIWKSYLNLKNKEISYDNSFEKYKDILQKSLVLYLMNYYQFIEKYNSFENINDYVLYERNDNYLKEIKFDNNFIILNEYSLLNSKCELIKSSNYELKIDKKEDKCKRGVLFNLTINDNNYELNADLLGLKDFLDIVVSELDLNTNKILHEEARSKKIELISINSFDNMYYGDYGEENNRFVVIGSENGHYIPNSIYDANDSSITFNKFTENDFSTILNTISNQTDTVANNIILYDICDNYDQFSSSKLRHTFNSIFHHSYPVWRSILAVESYGNSKIERVIDLCGKEMSITNLGYKKNKFIHKGPIEIPAYISPLTELDFYNEYLSSYEEKYGKLPQNIKDEIINNGSLNKLLEYKSDILIKNISSYYYIKFDKEIYNKEIEKFNNKIISIKAEFNNKTLFLLPNFIQCNDCMFINNESLIVGGRKIIERVKNKEITWYELLPELSLEVIEDGMFNTIKIVNNQEVDNIIGKSLKFDIVDNFVLKANQKDYKLPLNKSFIGENNKPFMATLKDDSFPLKQDVKVKLYIVYNFENENSYDLYFEPLENNAPFNKIEAEWHEQENNDVLIYPDIRDITYTKELCDKDLAVLDDKIYRLNNDFNSLKIAHNIKEYNYFFDEVLYKIDAIINTKQRLDHSSYSSESEKYNMKLFNYGFECKLNEIYQYCLNKISKKEMNVYWTSRIKSLEQGIVSMNLDFNLFKNNELIVPEACIGRYLSYKPYDKEFLNYTYQFIIKLSRKPKLLGDKTVHVFIDRLTSATSVDHLILNKIYSNNKLLVIKLQSILIRILKEISLYEWNQNQSEYYLRPKEVAMLFRFTLELIISLLFCREYLIFSDLRPGKNYANQIIYYLKIINKNYQVAIKKWEKDKKRPRMITKYRMKIDMPEDLNNTLEVCYCLILYLSGDEKANLIKIENKY